VSGAAQFNTAMVAAMRERGPVAALNWRRLYPPVLFDRQSTDAVSQPAVVPDSDPILDWCRPDTWRTAVVSARRSGARAVVVPWLHPVMAPPYAYLLRATRHFARRIVICHNVVPHEPVPAGPLITRAVLRHADLFVTHAPHQVGELAALGLGETPVLEAFHPRWDAAHLARVPDEEEVARERRRHGSPDILLLAFGAVRPYKGFDLALEALARIPRSRRVKLVVAGVFWDGARELTALRNRLGLEDRVELRDGFVSNDEAALLFRSADAAVLPYRSASQSGVAQMAFSYGTPVIATRVGGLPSAIDDGRTGVLCAPGDTDALVGAIERLADRREALAAGVAADAARFSFRRYAELIGEAAARLESRPQSHRRPVLRTAVGRVA
jgi:glycosyltransferase involved in cell wall biosynthesis